ncbi:heparin/heparin-sulfate lyase HepB [Paenibacillus sp. HJGM_3]|uniref:heparin/heparin-sulfate lyase HepB n=1 Tax=Paenibacillus sp. HJGM_3 TaxID=3379816 RepID=UPI00385E7D16
MTAGAAGTAAPEQVQTLGAGTPPVPPAAHPRLFVRTAADIAELKAKTTAAIMQPAWNAVMSSSALSAANLDVIKAKALRYLFGDGAAYGQQAIQLFDSYVKSFNNAGAREIGHMLVAGAIVYDWCYPLLSETNKTEWNALFRTHAEKMEIGYPPDLQGAISGHGAEDQVLRDQLSWAVAVYNEHPEVYNTVAGTIFSRYIPARDWYYAAGKHQRGDSYGPYTMTSDFVSALIFKKMSGIDIYDASQRNMMDYYLWGRRPDGSLLRDGDSTEDDQHPYGQYWRAPLPWMTAAGLYKDGYLQGEFLRNYSGANGTGTNDGGKLDPVLELVYADPTVQPKSVSDLPLTKYFGSPQGAMIARTGWTEGMNLQSKDVVADIRMNEYYFAGHEHLDAGAFQIYYKGALAIDSGNYGLYETPHHMNYSRRTIAHNALLVYDPNEKFEWHDKTPGTYTDPFDGGATKPLGNDGGQFWPNQAYEPYDLNDILNPAKGYKRSEVVAQQIGPDAIEPDFSYIKGYLTDNYKATKVSDYNRSFMFLNLKDDVHPAAIIVHDKVTSTDPSFKKTWLLHSMEQPVVSGNTTTIERTTDGYNGKLVNTTLLPSAPVITPVGGQGHEFQDYQGTNWPETDKATSSSELGAWRIEVSPSQPALTDTFLNVMQVSDRGVTPLATERVESAELEGVKIADRVVLFSKSGEKRSGAMTFSVAGSGSERLQFAIADLAAGGWTISGAASTTASVSAEGGVLSFTGGAGTYTIAPAGTPPQPGSDITAFHVNGHAGASVIDTTYKSVSFQVPYGGSLTGLTPDIRVSAGATIAPPSGTPRDFGVPAAYTVTSAAGQTATWTVSGTVNPPSAAKSILSLTVPGQVGSTVIEEAARTATFRLPYGTNVQALAPVIAVSPLATLAPASGTVRNFTQPVTYTVTAQDGSQQTYTVLAVLDPPSGAKAITGFTVPGQLGPSVIDAAQRTVKFTLPESSDATALTPTVTVSPGATVQPASGTAVNFTQPVVYTVRGQDGSTADWTVTLERSAAWPSTIAFQPFPLGTGNTGKVVAEFDMTPLKPLDPNGVNSLIGYADSSAVIDGYPKIPISIYFNPESSIFQVRNGNAWSNSAAIPIVVNKKYHFRLKVDFTAGTYSVWVTPQGEAEKLLFADAAFRIGATPIDDLGQLFLKSLGEDRSFIVENHSVTKDVWKSNMDFGRSAYSLGQAYTGKVKTEFDLTMTADINNTVNAILGYQSFTADDATMAYPKIPLSLYFDPGSTPPRFLTKNGNNTNAENVVPIVKNKKYHFEFEIDLPAKTYSVWVTPEGGTRTKLLTNGVFRTNSDPITNIGKVYLKSLGSDDVYYVENHTVTPLTTTPPAEPLKLAQVTTVGTSKVEDVSATSANTYVLGFDGPVASVSPGAFKVQRYGGSWADYTTIRAAEVISGTPTKVKLTTALPLTTDTYNYRLVLLNPSLVKGTADQPLSLSAGAILNTNFDRVPPVVASTAAQQANGSAVPNTLDVTFSERIIAFDKSDFVLKDGSGAVIPADTYIVERSKPDTLSFILDAAQPGQLAVSVSWPSAQYVQDAGGNKLVPSTETRTVKIPVIQRPAADGNALSRIWAVNDGETVKRDDLNNPNRDGNSVWDGKKIRLFGGRNEVLAFQVIVEAGTKGIDNLSLSLPELSGQGNAKSGRIAYKAPTIDPTDYVDRPIQIFSENYMNVTEPTQAGWIVPSSGPGSLPGALGWLPVQLVPENAKPGKGGFPLQVAPQQNQALWIDIYTAKDLPIGKYEGTVAVTVDGAVHTIPIELDLMDFTLPDENSMDAMIFYEGVQTDVFHGKNMDAQYNRLAHRNRVEFVKAYDPAAATAEIGRLNGSDFTAAQGYDGPGAGVGNHVVPRTFYGPGTLFDTPASAAATSNEWMMFLRDTFGADAKKTFAYMPDEPSDPLTFSYIRSIAGHIKATSGIGKELPVFVTSGYNAELDQGNLIDIWDGTPSHYDPKQALLERAHGDDMWIYNGSRPYSGAPVYEAPATDPRATIWGAYKMDIDTYFYWSAANWRHNSQMWRGLDRHQNVWLEPITYYNREPSTGNGDGVLVYPGENIRFPAEDRGIEGPISSIRLANMRRGLQDHLYMTMLTQRGQEDVVKEALADVVPGILNKTNALGFTETGDSFEEARLKLAKALEKAPDVRVPVISVSGAITTLLPRESVTTEQLAFTATATDADGNIIQPVVKLNGKVQASQDDVPGSYTVQLEEGDNTITIDAVAGKLKANTKTYTVRYVSKTDRLHTIRGQDGVTVVLEQRDTLDPEYAGAVSYQLYKNDRAVSERIPLGKKTDASGNNWDVRLYDASGTQVTVKAVSSEKPERAMTSKALFLESNHWLGDGYANQVVADFEVTPLANNIDGVIGYSDTSTVVDGFGKINLLVRLNSDGTFDARDGAVYAKDQAITYVKDAKYRIRIEADLAAKKYDVWITGPDGVKKQLAAGYAFRTGAVPIDDLGQLTVISTLMVDSFKLEKHVIQAVPAGSADRQQLESAIELERAIEEQ